MASRAETILAPLLNALDALEFVARHIDPTLLDAVMEAVDARDGKLRAARGPSDRKSVV